MRPIAFVLATLFVAAASTPALAQPSVTLQEAVNLGRPDDSVWTGQVAGERYGSTTTTGFLWTRTGGLIDLGPFIPHAVAGLHHRTTRRPTAITFSIVTFHI